MLPESVKNWAIATTRTGIGIVVSGLLTWLAAKQHVVISQATHDQLIVVAMAVIGVGYYAVVHALERRWKWVGLLLGVPAAPNYAQLQADGSFLVTDLSEDLGDFLGPDPLGIEGSDPNVPGASRPKPAIEGGIVPTPEAPAAG
jgi:hypothetical protein